MKLLILAALAIAPFAANANTITPYPRSAEDCEQYRGTNDFFRCMRIVNLDK